MTNINIAIVPVAGLGSRLLPATKSQPKEMLPVGRKPVVQYVVEELTRVGLNQILFITGSGKTSIENHFDLDIELIQTLRETGKEDLLAELSFERASVRYFYTRQRQLLGLGHAVLCAKNFVGDQPFVVALGDSIIGINAKSDVVKRMKEQFLAREATAVIAFEEVPRADVSRYGIAVPRDNGDIFELADVVEKPSVDKAPSNLAIAARYVFSPVKYTACACNHTKNDTTSATSTPTSAPLSNLPWPTKNTAQLCGNIWRHCSMLIIRKKSFARAGLLGNPSDGYHGKTISIILRNFWAKVTLYEWDSVDIILANRDRARFHSIHDLVKDVRLHGYYGGIRLIKATIKRFADYCQAQEIELHDQNFSIRYETNIPQQVGLAGSSAIITATLRALMEFYQVTIPLPAQPTFVLSVEEELGIAAGLQDRVIQCYEGIVYMDFSHIQEKISGGLTHYHYEPLDPVLVPNIYVAYHAALSEPTELFHNDIRSRYNRGEREIIDAMQHFALLAEQGREALLTGDAERLGTLIDNNFDTRRRLYRLPPWQIQMVETARACGASAKFAGSGG
ncbi:MAG: sugar phosphate nucleotidyltransferase, partial [Anaerolineae bacterium]